MRIICEQRVVWEGTYLNTHIRVFDCIDESLEDYILWLATDITGQVFVYYDKPTLLEYGIWGFANEDDEDICSILVAELEVDEDFDPSTTLLAITYT